MKKDKIYIVIIVILIIIVIFLAINLYEANKKLNSASDDSANSVLKTDSEIDKLVKEINFINANFQEDMLTEDGSFNNKVGKCLQYDFQRKNNNTSELIEKMKNIYRNFEEGDYYSVTQITYEDDTKEENLYVCVPEKCQIPIVDHYNIVEESNGKKTILFNDKYTFEVAKKDDKWQFDKPFMFCEE